jgi:hypothetical protein
MGVKMKTLEFWKDDAPIAHTDGTDTWETKWYCSDGISTYWGDTKSEAASHFGVPIDIED